MKEQVERVLFKLQVLEAHRVFTIFVYWVQIITINQDNRKKANRGQKQLTINNYRTQNSSQISIRFHVSRFTDIYVTPFLSDNVFFQKMNSRKF